MSVEMVLAFWRAVKADPQLQDRLRDCMAHHAEAAESGMIELAAKTGYPFTVQDYRAAVRQAQRQASEPVLAGSMSALGRPSGRRFG